MGDMDNISITSKQPELASVPATSASIAMARSSRSLPESNAPNRDFALLFLNGMTALIAPKRQGIGIKSFGNGFMESIFGYTKPITSQNNKNPRGKTMKEILDILENDPKIQPKEIATMTGLTEAQVASKIKEMEKKGIIRKYKTVIDWEKAGEEYVYAIIELKVVLRSRTGYDAIAERIAKFPEVVSVRLISGGHDLSLTVRGKVHERSCIFRC